MNMVRRLRLSWIIALIGLLALVGCSSQEEDSAKTSITLSSFGGDYEVAQKELVKEFEEEHNVEVKFVTLYSGDALVKVRAEKNAPSIDVVQFSGGQEVAAAQEDLIKKVDPSILTNQSDLYDIAQNKDGYAPHLAFDAVGLVYNADKIQTPPTSWKDLWKPEYKGQVGLVDISNTFGLQFVIMASKLNGGDESNLQPGLDQIKTLLPNTSAVVNTSPDVGNLFAQDEAWIVPYDSAYAFNFQQKGQNIKYVSPEEGAVATLINAQMVNGTKQEELAQELINFLLRPDIQQKFAEKTGFAPSNKKVELSDELAEIMPYGEESVSRLIPVDWEAVNKNLNRWSEEWKKMVSE